MSTTTLLAIVNRFVDQLGTIRVDNGYATDAGKIIDVLRERFGDDDPYPRIAILIGESPEKTRDSINSAPVSMRAVLVLCGYVEDDGTPAGPLVPLDRIEKDIIQAACSRHFQESLYASGGIQSISYLTSIHWPRASGGRTANVDVAIEIRWQQEITQ